ncbi:GFA family protein [Nereida sp. MMG025]|uniref:GFA family protein n=1 Tax=Nereida sp. MMG025 TaxID=2909981 RepID=UPI001F48002E|nr:GFA family protein [Nereida sp. MMG025]MCF6445013.1 GFA family protein [Nereida sp. MMG025]
MDSVKAGCACGAIRLVARGAPKRVGVCHCMDCRKHHGAVFYAAAIYDRSAVEITGDARAYEGRHFCGVCGGLVFAVTGGAVEVHLGAMDAPSQFVPTYEGFSDRRESWLPALNGAKRDL